jgi:homopolymeric O-antigen transport system ATP-binding protein
LSVILSVEGLGKRFKIYPSPWSRLREWTSVRGARCHADFWALRNVSLGVARGDCYGVIGPNGSGKTTLLKLLSGVLDPTEGSFRINSPSPSVFSLLELGTGFHPDLTGRQNVDQSTSLLGRPAGSLTPETVAQIEEFADIGEFFDRPIRFYSSGMLVRLGFALFAFLEPDLLIVDEALSVGDVFFQQKCAARIEAMRARGTTFLLVSHDMDAIRRMCREAMVLNHGEPIFQGPAEEAVNRYHALVFSRDPSRPAPHLKYRPADPLAGLDAEVVSGGNVLRPGGPRHGSRGIELAAARITGPDGNDTLSAPVGGILNFDLLIAGLETVASPSAGILIFDRFANLVFGSGTARHGHRLPEMHAGDSMLVRLSLCLNVKPGRYTFTLGVSELGHVQDWHEQLGPLEVYHSGDSPMRFDGIAELPLECRHAEPRRAGSLDGLAVEKA